MRNPDLPAFSVRMGVDLQAGKGKKTRSTVGMDFAASSGDLGKVKQDKSKSEQDYQRFVNAASSS